MTLARPGFVPTSRTPSLQVGPSHCTGPRRRGRREGTRPVGAAAGSEQSQRRSRSPKARQTPGAQMSQEHQWKIN